LAVDDSWKSGDGERRAYGVMEGVTYAVSWTPMQFDLSLWHRVIPAVRMTQRGKYVSPRAQAYLGNQESIAVSVREIMKRYHIKPFEADTRLGFMARFEHPKKWLRGDLNNLEKALEDALQGVVYTNDRQIWERGAGAKLEAPTASFHVRVWRLNE